MRRLAGSVLVMLIAGCAGGGGLDFGGAENFAAGSALGVELSTDDMRALSPSFLQAVDRGADGERFDWRDGAAFGDKKKGVFSYHEPFVPEEESALEAGYPEGYPELAPEASTPEEAALEAVAEELFGVEPGGGFEEERPSEPVVPPTPPEPGAKKGKEFKKRKPKAEGDKGPRPKKSERRDIEEKIVEEESVQEALAGVKEKLDETIEQQRAREKKEACKPVPKKEKKEEPKFGIFADLLKTALKKKPEDEDQPEEPAAEKPEGEVPAERPEEKPEGEDPK